MVSLKRLNLLVKLKVVRLSLTLFGWLARLAVASHVLLLKKARVFLGSPVSTSNGLTDTAASLPSSSMTSARKAAVSVSCFVCLTCIQLRYRLKVASSGLILRKFSLPVHVFPLKSSLTIRTGLPTRTSDKSFVVATKFVNGTLLLSVGCL